MPTPREIVRAAATREKPKKANPDEALWQHVQEESTQEFVGADCHCPRRTPVRVVLPPKRDQVVGHVDDAVIRDGDAVRIAREVVQDVGRPTKGWFGIDDPILAEERAEEGAKSAFVGQVLEGASTRQHAALKSAL